MFYKNWDIQCNNQYSPISLKMVKIMVTRSKLPFIYNICGSFSIFVSFVYAILFPLNLFYNIIVLALEKRLTISKEVSEERKRVYKVKSY